jgi:hypothetical protein
MRTLRALPTIAPLPRASSIATCSPPVFRGWWTSSTAQLPCFATVKNAAATMSICPLLFSSALWNETSGSRMTTPIPCSRMRSTKFATMSVTIETPPRVASAIFPPRSTPLETNSSPTSSPGLIPWWIAPSRQRAA